MNENLLILIRLAHRVYVRVLSVGKHIKKVELFYRLPAEKAVIISPFTPCFFIFHLYLFA